MAQPTDGARARAELDELTQRFESLIHARVRGVAPLAWAEQTADGELVGVSAFVRPERAHSGGVTVTVYGVSVALAVGPTEMTFVHRNRGVALERALDALAAMVNGGARIEVFERWWRTVTRTVVPAYGNEVESELFRHEFPGYPIGTHFVAPALITDVGRSGAALTHSAGEIAIGTATEGAQIGARVSITDDGGFWFQWEGPDEHHYSDSWHEASDMVEVLRAYEGEIEWDWMDPDFAEWIASSP